ncbi:MAG: type II secretion system protein [Bacilli bacterium]
MREKNGFTLVEVMTVVVILGIIVAIGVGVYNGVSERQRQKAYEDKVKYIEMTAEKWADETNLSKSTTITVSKLIESSYYQADSYDANKDEYIVEDPRTGESMLCNTISITIENGNAVATLNDVIDCDLMKQESDSDKIRIAAYAYDTTTKKVVKVLKEKNQNILSLDWTNKAVLLAVEPDSEFSNYNKIVYSSNGKSNTKEVVNNNKINVAGIKVEDIINVETYANVYVVDTKLFFNAEYTISVDVKDSGFKSNYINIKIDKEPPKAAVTKTNEYTNELREIKINGSDGAGSGLKGFYITKDKDTYNENEFRATSKETSVKLGNGTYYIYAEDNAGNIAEAGITNITNVDQTGPTCIIHADGKKGSNDWFIGNVTFSLEYDDAESGVFSHNISDTSLTKDTTLFKVTGETKDNMGNGNYCELTVKKDSVVPNKPIITASDNIASNGWHAKPFTLTGSGGTNISGNTYYYGLTNNPTSTTKSSITLETSGTTYYVKVCSGAGLCNVESYVAKLDMTPPSAPTGGNIGTTDGRGQGTIQTPASGASDNSDGCGGVYYMYLVNTSGVTPDKNDSGFTTSLNYPRKCGTTYYAYAIAVDAVGNRSEVKYLGNAWSFTCSYSPTWRTETYACGTETHESCGNPYQYCYCRDGYSCSPRVPGNVPERVCWCNNNSNTCETRRDCSSYTTTKYCSRQVPECTKANSYYNSSTGLCDYY